MYRLKFRKRARKRLEKIAKRSPQIAKGIYEKITWLVENADVIAHERLKGHREYSLHFGQYRIPYSLDRANKVITIEDIDKHDEAYKRL
jgi:mRNA-degrading endonuclease RelE of RelBE toxin-antitoxin system